ncbi:hypothetical protein [Xanthobacter sediminis]|uniref:hypothetical protein n=1 Tax=Xanthobacter sediminis TaxID=3119926 RepID=UPI003726AD0D
MGEEKVATEEVSAESIADLVVAALGKKGLLGDVGKRLEFLMRRTVVENFRPTFTAATTCYAQAPASALLLRLYMSHHNHTTRFALAIVAHKLEETHRGSVSAQ